MPKSHPFTAFKEGSRLDKSFESFRRSAAFILSLAIVAVLVWMGTTYKSRDERVWLDDTRSSLDNLAVAFLGRHCPPMGGADAGCPSSFVGSDTESASGMARLANSFAAFVDASDASLADQARVAMVRLQYASAAKLAGQAVEEARQRDGENSDHASDAALVEALSLQARALAASGNGEGAADAFREAAELSASLGDQALTAQIERQLACVLCCIRKGGLAPWRDSLVMEEESALRLALTHYERHGSPSEYAATCVRLACLLYTRAQSAPSPYREAMLSEAAGLFRDALSHRELDNSSAALAREWLALTLCNMAGNSAPAAASQMLDQAYALFLENSSGYAGSPYDCQITFPHVTGMIALARSRLESGARRAEFLTTSIILLRASLDSPGSCKTGMRRVVTIAALGEALCMVAADDAGANQARLYWEAGMALSEAETVFTRDVSFDRWLELHYFLGVSVSRFGAIANDSDRLDHGIGVLDEVIHACGDTHPSLGVKARIELCAARARKANVDSLRDMVAELDAFSSTDGIAPSVRAECRLTQGDVLARLAGMSNAAEAMVLLQKAIEAYADACDVLSRDAYPSRWTRLRMATGHAGLSLALLQTDPAMGSAKASDAANACTDALTVFTWENAPEAWTRAKRVLGRAHCLSAELSGDKTSRQAHIEAAINALRESLSGPSEGDDPEDRARTRMLLASVLRMDASMGTRERHEMAIEELEKVLEYFTRETHPVEWAGVQAELGLNIMFSPRPDAPRNAPDYPGAAGAFRRALEVHSREMFPDKWAADMQRLAECLFAQISLPADDEILAIARETRDVIKELLRSPELLSIDERRHMLDEIVACCAVVAHFAVDDDMAGTDELLRYSAMRCAALEGSEGFLQAMVDHGSRLVHAANLASGDDVRRRVAIAVAHYRELLVLLDDPSAAQVRTQSAPALADSLGTLSWLQTLVYRDFAGAEESARRAFSFCPQKRWVLINLAHALLLSGQTDRAEAICRENALSTVATGRLFGEYCIDDFAELREAGLGNPEMDRIEAVIRGILQGAREQPAK